MEISKLDIEGVFKIDLQPKNDSRGYFMRTFDSAIFESFGAHHVWVQENQSFTKIKHTIRGLHFQFPPFSETKLIRVLTGRILDVFVDCRSKSKTFGQFGRVVLDENVPACLLLPKGIAHGFCSLTDNVLLSYKVDAPYSASHDAGIRWNDPDLKIDWMIEKPVEISEKDAKLPLFKDQTALFKTLEFC